MAKTTKNENQKKNLAYSLKPPLRMEFDTIKKLIMRQHYVFKNSRVAFFSNDPKTDQPNILKTSTNVLFESMTINIR